MILKFIKFTKKVALIFTYGEEIEQVLIDKRNEMEDEEREARKHNLNLCLKHQQEQYHSHYAEHNCDYCIAMKEIDRLNSIQIGVKNG